MADVAQIPSALPPATDQIGDDPAWQARRGLDYLIGQQPQSVPSAPADAPQSPATPTPGIFTPPPLPTPESMKVQRPPLWYYGAALALGGPGGLLSLFSQRQQIAQQMSENAQALWAQQHV